MRENQWEGCTEKSLSRRTPTLLPPIRSFHPVKYIRDFKDIIIYRNMIICTYIRVYFFELSVPEHTTKKISLA